MDAGGDRDGGSEDSGACRSGAPCNPSGNACQEGVISCASGSSTCTPVGNAANGSACGANQVCFAGVCGLCTAGTACTPNGNLCQTGAFSCDTGLSTCVATGDAANGTVCGVGICCGGNCAACVTASHAMNTCSGSTCTSVCNAGFSLCGTSCVDTTSNVNACGPSCAVCPTGSACVASQCTNVATTVRYGESSEFSPCGVTAGALAASVLYAQPLTIPAAMTLTAFGVFGNQPATGINGIMALYTDGNGAPLAPIAFSANTPIVAGDNALPVTPPMAVPAGAYWIAGEFDGNASICTDSAATNQIDFMAVFPYGLTPSPFRDVDGGAPRQLTQTIDINFYVVGTK